MAKVESNAVPVKVEEFKQLFVKNKIKMTAVCAMMGKHANHLSSRLNLGSLDRDELKKICDMFGVNAEDYILKEEPPKEEPKAAAVTASVDLSEIHKKLQSIDDIQVEILTQLKVLSKSTVDASIFRSDVLKICNEALETVKNMKVEVHNDQKRLYDHLKFNQVLTK